MPHVVCVGDLMVDIVAQLPGPLAAGSDTPAPVTIHGGGAAANVAAWLVECGVPATFFGRIGDDSLGLRAVEELTAAGVNPLVTIDLERATGTCIVLVDETGERTMVPCAGANDADNEAALLPREADLLYLSGYALMNTGSRPYARETLRIARERGWSLAVDAASAAPLRSVGPDEFLAWLGRDVVLFANAEEAQVLCGDPDPERAAVLLARGCGEAVVKRGVDGAIWSDGEQVHTMPASRTSVVDSTGAGDAFAAGFLAARIRGAGVADALGAGASCGARVVGQPGARPPLR